MHCTKATASTQCQLTVARAALQAAYTAIEAFQAQFPSAGEDAARLKEEVYALLEERAQHARQRQWRLVQKKRAREEAQAHARTHQETGGAETAVLAMVSGFAHLSAWMGRHCAVTWSSLRAGLHLMLHGEYGMLWQLQ